MIWKISPLLNVVFCLTTCSAKMSINITVNTRGNVDLKVFGDDNKRIGDEECRLFGLTDDNLKWGTRVELGKVPDEVFLKNPTPYGDLYTKYKWQEVKRNLRVKTAKVIEIFKYNTILKTDVYVNNATEPMKIKRNLSKRVENTVYSLWSKEGLPVDNIVYDLSINFSNGILNYKNGWRNSTTRNIYLSLGVSTIGEAIIDPGKEIVKQLSATKIIAVIEIIYEARLIGQLVANYARVYGKYHFWAPNINDIMKRVYLKNQIETREVIEIRCYINPVLNIFDKITGDVAKFVYETRKVHKKNIDAQIKEYV